MLESILHGRDLAIPLTPTFAMFNAERNTWISPYLPVYAAIRAIFSILGIRSLTNAALAGLSILALAGIVRKLWPREESFPLIACLLLATSSQFLLMSMTAFSMPAHLYLNLVWLWLYTRNDRWSCLATPWIGVLAMGLHNPVVHGTFRAPLLDPHRTWEAVAKDLLLRLCLHPRVRRLACMDGLCEQWRRLWRWRTLGSPACSSCPVWTKSSFRS